MAIANIFALIVLVVLIFVAVKFLIGILRVTVTSALFLLAIGVVMSLVTGQDVISPTVGYAVKFFG